MTLATVPKYQESQWLAQGARKDFPPKNDALQRGTELGMPPGERSIHSEAREMAQQAKVLATKPGDLSLIARLPHSSR